MPPAVPTTRAALQVKLEQWRLAAGTYDPAKLNQLVDIVTKHQLHLAQTSLQKRWFTAETHWVCSKKDMLAHFSCSLLLS